MNTLKNIATLVTELTKFLKRTASKFSGSSTESDSVGPFGQELETTFLMAFGRAPKTISDLHNLALILFGMRGLRTLHTYEALGMSCTQDTTWMLMAHSVRRAARAENGTAFVTVVGV